MLVVLEGEYSTYRSERCLDNVPSSMSVGRHGGQEGRDLLMGSLLPHEGAEELGAVAQR